ncbi:hypothetical protein SK128_016782, partial [Halocaridina rubra]
MFGVSSLGLLPDARSPPLLNFLYSSGTNYVLHYELHETFGTWEKYHHLWRIEKETAIRDFIASSPSLQDYDKTLKSYVLLDKKIRAEPSRYRVGAFLVNT